MKVCRICLSKDGRLYPITSNGLRSLYHQLTGVPKLEMDVDKRLPQWVCAECGLRLMSYNKLRQKSLRAHQILCQLLERASYITEEDVNKIDRETNHLKSNLNYAVIGNIYKILDKQIQIHDDSLLIPATEPKEILKIEEAIVHSEGGNTELFFKIEQDSNSPNRLSETADTDTENNSELESDSISNTPLSNLKELNNHTDLSNSVKKNVKIRNKKRSLDVKKHFDKYLHLYNIKSDKHSKKGSNKRIRENIKKGVSRSKRENLKKGSSKKDGKKVDGKQKKVKNAEQISIDDYFTVRILSLDEQKAHIEKRKYSVKYTEAVFKCKECFKGFMNEVAYSRHQFFHSESRGQYQCKICKIRFRIQTSFYHHTMSHKYVYSCQKCEFTCSTKSTAIQHRSKHKGKVYKCTHCGVEFSLQSTYLSHLRIKHVSKFVCDICGYSFVSAKGVELHRKFKHSQENYCKQVSIDGPTCATCNLRFVSDEALKTHMRVSHAKMIRNDDGYPGASASVICELCGVKIAGGRQYRIHFRRHHPSRKQTLLPVRAVADQTSVCEQCGKVFKYKCNLQKHALLHTGQKPYQCDCCHKKFATKPLIHSHIVNCHLPKKNQPKVLFPCSICGKEFANAGNRVRHMVIHSDLRPFSCEICGSSFKTKGEVKAHTTHVHLKVPWPKKQARSSTHGAMQYL